MRPIPQPFDGASNTFRTLRASSVAENGFCTRDGFERPDGWTREKSLVHHLHHLERAIEDGAPVLGYLHWSLLDNWELGSFHPRFGLFRVDHDDPALTRTATPAVEVLAEIAAARGVTPALRRRFGID